jgi:hypothetical protein
MIKNKISKTKVEYFKNKKMIKIYKKKKKKKNSETPKSLNK